MVQIDLKKLREMQESNSAQNTTKDPGEAIETAVQEAPIAPIEPSVDVTPPLAATPIDAPSVIAAASEDTPAIETPTENIGFKLQLSDLHKKPAANVEALSRQEREKELAEVFSEITTNNTPPEGEGDRGTKTEQSTNTSPSTESGKTPTQAGFFPSLSFIAESTAPEVPKTDSKPITEEPLVITQEISTSETSATDIPHAPQEKERDKGANSLADTGTIGDTSSPVPAEPEASQIPTEELTPSETITIGSAAQDTPTINSPITPLPPTNNKEELHPTNKKSLMILGGAVAFIVLLGSGTFAWVYLSKSEATLPTPATNTADTTSNVTLTGETSTEATASGVIDTNSGSLSQSGETLTIQSGSTIPQGQSGAVLTGSISSSSGAQTGSLGSGSTQPVSASGSSSGSIKSVTSTGTSASPLSTNSGSTLTKTGAIQTTNPTQSSTKYQEGKDYRVYGGGYKLIRKEP